MKYVIRYVKPHIPTMIFGFTIKFTGTILDLMIPYILSYIIDEVTPRNDIGLVIRWGLMMAVCAVISMVLGVGSARFAAVCGQGVGAEIRKNEYRKLQQFSFANTDRFRTSSLVTRLTGDVTNIQNSISTGMRPACRAPVMMITAIAVSFYINSNI